MLNGAKRAVLRRVYIFLPKSRAHPLLAQAGISDGRGIGRARINPTPCGPAVGFARALAVK